MYSYHGMFRNGKREGLGITKDLDGNKYKGEHKMGLVKAKVYTGQGMDSVM